MFLRLACFPDVRRIVCVGRGVWNAGAVLGKTDASGDFTTANINVTDSAFLIFTPKSAQSTKDRLHRVSP